MKINIKKLRIKKTVKTVLLTVIVLIIGVLAFLLYKELKIPKINEEVVKLFSYTNKSSTDYKVLLKPNSLYNETSLDEGQYCITSYVDSIEAAFNYEYKGERLADIKGNYEVVADIEGFIIQEKEQTTICRRKVVLLPKTEFGSKDIGFALTKSISIKLSEYNDFVAAFAEESEVQIPFRLNVYMEVNLKADTDKGPVEAKATPSITIPLDEGYFLITESEAKEEPGSIDETRKVSVPPDSGRVLLYECGLGILLIAALILALFTEAVSKSAFTKQLEKIFKQHGSRLVAVNSDIFSASMQNCSIVRNMDDLVRVADELGKPIMYEHRDEYTDMVHFYVLDERLSYIYALRDIAGGANISIVGEKEIGI